jgi:RimJ/RimL family protein N-acetyltransferase
MPDVALPYEFSDPLRTERLIVRAMTPADVGDVHAYQSHPDVCRYLPFEPRTLEEVTAKVAGFATALTLAADGDHWSLAVERAEQRGRVIGDVYFRLKSTADATGEIGWTLHPDFAGKGYMTEAAGAVLELAFSTLRLRRVVAVLDPRNEASNALCGRLGMRQEAHFVEDTWFKGEWGDTAIYALLERDWAAPPG